MLRGVFLRSVLQIFTTGKVKQNLMAMGFEVVAVFGMFKSVDDLRNNMPLILVQLTKTIQNKKHTQPNKTRSHSYQD